MCLLNKYLFYVQSCYVLLQFLLLSVLKEHQCVLLPAGAGCIEIVAVNTSRASHNITMNIFEELCDDVCYKALKFCIKVHKNLNC